MNTDEHRYKSKSKIRFLSAFICVYLWLIAFAFPVFAHEQETITVAVASSLYPKMQQQAKAFEKQHDVTIRLVSGSTGRLYNQIMQGAPFDAFIAADEQRPALLVKQGKVLEQFEMGQGYLGLMRGQQQLANLVQLTDPFIRHIAIANPDVAPFGSLAKKLLVQQGLWQTLKPKFVYTQNALQANMLVEKGLVDVGFVSISSRERSIALITYHGVVLKSNPLARLFLNKLRSNAILPYKIQTALRKELIMNRSEKELDFLETYIPKLAESATKKAYLDTLSKGISVTELVDGNIVSTAPDGTQTFIKKATPWVKVKKHD